MFAFRSGGSSFNDTLYIYYGAADERIACASVSLSGLINELLLNKLSTMINKNKIKSQQFIFRSKFFQLDKVSVKKIKRN
jgi:hypothetical protein